MVSLVAEILLILQNQGIIPSTEADKLIYRGIVTFKELVNFIEYKIP